LPGRRKGGKVREGVFKDELIEKEVAWKEGGAVRGPFVE